MSVDSIEDAEAKITAAGGTVVQSKQAIPTMGWFSTYKDTEGNTFGTVHPGRERRLSRLRPHGAGSGQ